MGYLYPDWKQIKEKQQQAEERIISEQEQQAFAQNNLNFVYLSISTFPIILLAGHIQIKDNVLLIILQLMISLLVAQLILNLIFQLRPRRDGRRGQSESANGFEHPYSAVAARPLEALTMTFRSWGSWIIVLWRKLFDESVLCFADN